MLLQHGLNALRILLLQLNQLGVHLIVLLRLLNHLLTQLLDVLKLLGDVVLLLILHLIHWVHSCRFELGRPVCGTSAPTTVLCNEVENLCTLSVKK